ncbi:unnamed protein product [Ostreobium quekettii]|uniref:Uncharacterized protein n=1 Tax=Ostreobium quekettii TaxID=121088 RepID=A0A8S1IQH4_9CHLO|nr:unnamed protein product [Ostreobium quekettii]
MNVGWLAMVIDGLQICILGVAPRKSICSAMVTCMLVRQPWVFAHGLTQGICHRAAIYAASSVGRREQKEAFDEKSILSVERAPGRDVRDGEQEREDCSWHGRRHCGAWRQFGAERMPLLKIMNLLSGSGFISSNAQTCQFLQIMLKRSCKSF